MKVRKDKKNISPANVTESIGISVFNDNRKEVLNQLTIQRLANDSSRGNDIIQLQIRDRKEKQRLKAAIEKNTNWPTEDPLLTEVSDHIAKYANDIDSALTYVASYKYADRLKGEHPDEVFFPEGMPPLPQVKTKPKPAESEQDDDEEEGESAAKAAMTKTTAGGHKPVLEAEHLEEEEDSDMQVAMERSMLDMKAAPAKTGNVAMAAEHSFTAPDGTPMVPLKKSEEEEFSMFAGLGKTKKAPQTRKKEQQASEGEEAVKPKFELGFTMGGTKLKSAAEVLHEEKYGDLSGLELLIAKDITERWKGSDMDGYDGSSLSGPSLVNLAKWVRSRTTAGQRSKYVINCGKGTGTYSDRWQLKVSGFGTVTGSEKAPTYHIAIPQFDGTQF